MQFVDNVWPWSACTSVHTDQGLRSRLTESMDIVVYDFIEEQRMSKSDGTGVHTHLDLQCLYMA